MKKASFDAIVRGLNEARVPFLVVGGIAVIHHGYGRLTQDVDLVIKLEPDIIRRAFDVLERLGYHPSVPVSAEELADSHVRERWSREKSMKVLRFWSDAHRETPVDVFVNEPFDFEEEYARADVRESLPGVPVHIISLETLLAMKRFAGRPQDLADIHELALFRGRESK